jgi:hypothetical protein
MPLVIMLLALGGALVVFGAVVLLRYADRPGGSVKWMGLELSSSGAGLPLIALGIGCVVLAVVRWPSAAPPGGTPSTAAGNAPGGAPGGAPGSALTDTGRAALAAAGDTSECGKIRALPADRVDTVEAGMRDLELIGPHQPQDAPFGIVLTDGGRPIGAIRFRRFRGPDSSSDLYRIEAVVDAACRPVSEVRNTSRGGDPRALINWDTVRLRLGGHEYDLRIGGEGSIGGNFTRIG